MAKIVRDWTKLIVPRVNENNQQNGDDGDKSLRTTDTISIRSWEEVENQTNEERQRSLTDFALMNYTRQSDSYETEQGKRTGAPLLRSADFFKSTAESVHFDGSHYWSPVESVLCGLCPALSLQLPSKISKRSASREIGEVREVKSEDGKTLYHTIELGEYPKTRVSSNIQEELESMYNGGHLRGGLKCTGKLYTTNGRQYSDEYFLSKQNPEFEINGEKYVRVSVMPWEGGYYRQIYEDGSNVGETGNVQWVKVEPITFRISNYREFALGKAKTLELDSDEIILSGIPFYPDRNHDNCSMWQNSMVRAFMNSAKTSEMDGNPEYEAPLKFDFRNSGMLYQAFNMTRQPTREYIIPENEKEVCDYALRGCVGIDKIIIPSHVTKIGKSAFSGCVNSQLILQSLSRKLSLSEDALEGTDFKFVYIAKDGGSLILSPREDATLDNGYFKCDFKLEDTTKIFNNNYRENFVQLKTWKQEGKIKFIPPEYTMQIFPSSEMQKYFVNKNNQRWGRLVKTLGFDTLEGIEKNNSLVDLMKIYYAIGGFSDNQGESERAFDYVLKYVATTRKLEATPSQIGQEIHGRFSKIKLKGAYNPTFAQFFMKHYHQNPDFMNFRLTDKYGYLMDSQDYLCLAHNAFDRIMKNYPNRVVTGNEERALLTPRFVAEHSSIVEYNCVDDGNELLAEIVGKYGYDEEQFEHIQEVYNEAKTIKDKYVISADRAKGKNGITFRILEKDDPIGFILGDITNCCQHIGGAGEECVDDGYTNPNAGFLVFEESELDEDGKPTGEIRILGQAYVWYDPQTNTVCYDNIEIPTKVLDELRRGNRHGERLSSKALMDSVVESADAIMLAMNRKGIKVDRVTTGQGYNDLRDELEDRFGSPERNPKAQHRGYSGYSDADKAQYVIRTYDEVTREYADTIRETANTIRADLSDIRTAESQKGYEM